MSYPFRCVRVIDGDTFVADIDLTHPDLGMDVTLRNVHIRVFGINTPERGKPGATEARSATEAYLAQPCILTCYGLDKYGRTLGDAHAAGELYSLADDLLSGGLAVPLKYRVSIPLSMDAGIPIWTERQ